MMNKGKVELVKFDKSDDYSEFIYSIEQNNGKTSVEQKLTISSVNGLFKPKWTAHLELKDFPPQDTPESASLKMADWLERLAATMRKGSYLDLPHTEFRDLDV